MFQADPIENNNKLIHDAVLYDNVDELSRLLKIVHSENIKGNHDNYNYLLLIASIHCSFEVMKFLLLSPELEEHANINTRNDQIFKNICRQGRLDILKFILETPELNRLVDKEATVKSGLLEAAIHNQLEIFKYFAHDYKIYKKINLNSHYIKCLITAYERENYPKDEDEIMSYIILNLSITKSKRLSNYIEKNNAVELKELFDKQEFNKSLYSELTTNTINKKRMKI